MWYPLPYLPVPGSCASEDHVSETSSEVAEQKSFDVVVEGEVGDVVEKNVVVDGVEGL